MKAFLLAVVVAALISVGAGLGMGAMDFSTAALKTSDNVRLD